MLTLEQFVRHWEDQQTPGSDGTPSGAYWPGCVEMAASAIAWMKELIDWPLKSVLEIGCCDGAVLKLFEDEGVSPCYLYGLTLFNEEADLLEAGHPDYNVYVDSMHMFDYDGDHGYDLVMAQRTLEHSPVAFYVLYRMMKLAHRYVLIGQAPWPRLVNQPRHYSQEPTENIWNWVKKLGGNKIGQLDKPGVWFLIDASDTI